MKSPVVISRSGPRELATVKKVTVTIAGLCLVAGSIVFFRSKPNFPTDTIPARPQPDQPAIRQNPGEAAAPTAPEASAARSAIPTTYQSPSLTPAGSVDSPATEMVLPPPPSGDYELNLTAEQIGALVEKRYGGLFRTLALPPEHLARLRSLLAERQQVTVDAANSSLLNGLNPIRDLPIIRNAIEEAQASVDVALRNELGEQVFAACREFDRTLGERNSAGDLARLLTETGDPLRPEQEKQLVHILKTFPGKNSPVDIDRAIFGGINTRARISEQALAEAAPVLSPLQLELLRQLQRHWAAEDARH